MDRTEQIRDAFERNERAIGRLPSIAAKTARSVARIVEGVRCEVTEGRWTLVADLHEKAGGTGAGPDPSVLGRAAFTSCLAMGLALWSAKLGVPLGRVEVEAETDYDAGAQYGVGDAPPGFTEVRYTVTIESPAPPEDVERVLEAAEKTSVWHDVYARPQKLVRTVRISRIGSPAQE